MRRLRLMVRNRMARHRFVRLRRVKGACAPGHKAQRAGQCKETELAWMPPVKRHRPAGHWRFGIDKGVRAVAGERCWGMSDDECDHEKQR